ncbi:cation diffusion facilitator family transporter [Roseibium sp. RKSG952]|uniref:cation diffusion facilitator family transporter n=1 Tax=Roseibium sp. RKSG952 TaxID=2529384 RepID=UPI0012BD5682|nr:cation diffusion facilitator family transporter [Roseibium sp. RKSG952]MTH98303.1 cation transporter [Roseibium sp. RKSG952]
MADPDIKDGRAAASDGCCYDQAKTGSAFEAASCNPSACDNHRQHSAEHGHHHSHNHSHDHGGHAHSHTPEVTDRNARAVGIACLLITGFMFAELIGGWLAGSLTLIADAMHMITDAGSLGLAWWAFQQSKKPADARLTYGRDRLPVLIAFANAIFLLAVTAWIAIEAVERFLNPQTVLAGPMFVIAVLGLFVNIAAFLVLSRGGDGSLNIRSAVLHVLGDLLGSVGAIVAAVTIYFTGWFPVDPILSVFVSLLIVRSAISVLRQSAHILLEGAPEEIDRSDMAEDLVQNIQGISYIHHVHLWSLAEGKVNATLHATIADGACPKMTVKLIRQRLADQYGVGHATIEVETLSPAQRPAG